MEDKHKNKVIETHPAIEIEKESLEYRRKQMNTTFNAIKNIFGGMSKKERDQINDAKYNSSIKGRFQLARQYHSRSIAPLTNRDNFTVQQLENMWESTDYCPCCGKAFITLDDAQIAHIQYNGNFTKSNLFLICGECNKMQRQIFIDFNVFFKVTQSFFLDYFETHQTQIVKLLNLSNNDIRRINKRMDVRDNEGR